MGIQILIKNLKLLSNQLVCLQIDSGTNLSKRFVVVVVSAPQLIPRTNLPLSFLSSKSVLSPPLQLCDAISYHSIMQKTINKLKLTSPTNNNLNTKPTATSLALPPSLPSLLSHHNFHPFPLLLKQDVSTEEDYINVILDASSSV
jgi:hypothetical protein